MNRTKSLRFNLFSAKWINRNNAGGVIFCVGFFISILAFFFLRETLIDIRVMLLIYLTPGLILTPIFYSSLNNLSDKKGHFILHYIVHTFVAGGLLLYLFMSSNYYFAEENGTEKIFNIERVDGYQTRRRTRHVVILHDGVERNIYFPKEAIEDLFKAKKVKVRFYEGFWHFKIVKNNELVH